MLSKVITKRAGWVTVRQEYYYLFIIIKSIKTGRCKGGGPSWEWHKPLWYHCSPEKSIQGPKHRPKPNNSIGFSFLSDTFRNIPKHCPYMETPKTTENKEIIWTASFKKGKYFEKKLTGFCRDDILAALKAFWTLIWKIFCSQYKNPCSIFFPGNLREERKKGEVRFFIYFFL